MRLWSSAVRETACKTPDTDAEEHDREHHGEVEGGDLEKEDHEPEPDDLEGKQNGPRAERSEEHSRDAFQSGYGSLDLCLLDPGSSGRRRGGCTPSLEERPGQPRSEEVARSCDRTGAPQTEPLHEEQLGHKNTRNGAERVPSVESPQGAAKVPFVSAQGLHQQRQGHAHEARRYDHEGAMETADRRRWVTPGPVEDPKRPPKSPASAGNARTRRNPDTPMATSNAA